MWRRASATWSPNGSGFSPIRSKFGSRIAATKSKSAWSLRKLSKQANKSYSNDDSETTWNNFVLKKNTYLAYSSSIWPNIDNCEPVLNIYSLTNCDYIYRVVFDIKIKIVIVNEFPLLRQWCQYFFIVVILVFNSKIKYYIRANFDLHVECYSTIWSHICIHICKCARARSRRAAEIMMMMMLSCKIRKGCNSVMMRHVTRPTDANNSFMNM